MTGRLADPPLGGTKSGLLVRRLAAELILLERGQQLPTVAQLAQKFEVGHGTVQRALKILEELGAVRVQARGHLGSYVLEKDLRKLWEAAGTPTLLGGLPLPLTRRLRGLATAVAKELREGCPSVDVVYLPGSRKRLGHLRRGRLDFIVISRFAAERARCTSEDVVIACALGPRSYRDPAGFGLLERRGRVKRIGVDYHSCDHYWCTEIVFRRDAYEYVNIPYQVIPEAVRSGEIDGAVWYGEDGGEEWPAGIEWRRVEFGPIGESVSEACVVVAANNAVVRELVMRHLNVEHVQRMVGEVVRGNVRTVV